MNNRSKVVLAAVVLTVALVADAYWTGLASPVIVPAQEQERVIDKLSWRNEPIKVIKVRTKSRPIELGKKFLAGEDWLDGLMITVENAFNKAITRVEFDLRFLPPKASSPDAPEKPSLLVSLVYGQDPTDASAERPLKLVLPGESVDVTLHASNLPFIRANLQKLGYEETITRAQIMINAITFVDGSQWDWGEMFYPDPNNPKQKFNPKYPNNKQSDRSKPAVQRSAFPEHSSFVSFLTASITHVPNLVNTELS